MSCGVYVPAHRLGEIQRYLDQLEVWYAISAPTGGNPMYDGEMVWLVISDHTPDGIKLRVDDIICSIWSETLREAASWIDWGDYIPTYEKWKDRES